MTRSELKDYLAETDDKLLPGPEVMARYGLKHAPSLSRWLKRPGLNFPKPLVINGRNYFRLSELHAWEREQAIKSAAQANAPRMSKSGKKIGRPRKYHPAPQPRLPVGAA